ncbi:MAG: hypothetical protein Ta2D_05570 [Rickettsiales bacterium]|nr:MAG: hypothetical protein Ta2D_05570 [Rickettsiales bacterium]
MPENTPDSNTTNNSENGESTPPYTTTTINNNNTQQDKSQINIDTKGLPYNSCFSPPMPPPPFLFLLPLYVLYTILFI